MQDLPAHKITIFVSSPIDVMAERERAAHVIDLLQSRFRENVTLAPVFFEDKETYYTADKSFQQQIPDAGGSDLVVSIFWSSLGSELAPDLFGTMPDGKPYPGGAVYELMRALAAKRQRNLPDILVYRKIADTGISVTDPQRRRLMIVQLDAFEAFWKQWFVSEEGHFRAGFQTFKRPEEFEQLLEGHLRSWLSEKGLLGREVIWRVAERGSPFRGLEPYEPQHADVFFGRDREIDRGRDRLLAAAARGTAFLLVMGPSGAGKSSLARGGLVTRLTQPGDVAGVGVVRFAALRPGAAATPQRALAEALFRPEALPELVHGDSATPALLAATLEADAPVAVLPILAALGRSKTYACEARLVIVVDQLEELFATTVTDIARQSFVRLLFALAREGHIFIIATLRSSDYGALARETELLALKDAGGTLDITVPGPEVLADIVRRPAMAAGLIFNRREDKNLDEELLAAAGGNADALPLLGFTLQWLFEHRTGERLTFEAYDQLGGLDGAIGRAAEEAFGRLDRETQAALPQLLRGLAESSHRAPGLALRDMPLAGAREGAPLRKLADALVAARILLLRDEGHGAMLRLAHDAVLRGWDRARDITTREQDFFRIRDALIPAEQRWSEQRRNDLLLAPGLPLAEAQSLASTYGAELTRELLAFINASVHKEQRRQRRGYALAAMFGLVAIIAVVAGVLAWRQQRIATAQAFRADQNFTSAKSTVNHVILDLAGGLQDLDFEDTSTIWLGIPTPSELRGEANKRIILQALGPVPVTSDDVAAAYRDALQTARKLAAEDPGDRRRQRDVALILSNLGDALKDRADALAAYRESLQTVRALATKDPSNTQWQRDVSVSLVKVGDVLEAQRDHGGALANYRESLNIRRVLTTKDPSNTQWQRDVSVSLIKVGDVLEAQGDHAGALANYRESLNIRRVLTTKDPSNTQWQRDLGLSLEKLGNELVVQGDHAGALAFYRESLQIRRALTTKDPRNWPWQRDLELSLKNVDKEIVEQGHKLGAQGDHAGALAIYGESLNIRRALAAKEPNSTERQSDIAQTLDLIGAELGAQGDHAAALANYRESLNIRRALATKAPNFTEWQSGIAWGLDLVGGELAAQGDHAGALANHRESLNIRRALATKEPGSTERQSEIAWSLDWIGGELGAQGDPAGALAIYRESLNIRRTLATKDPRNAKWHDELRFSIERVGGMAYRFLLVGDFTKALESADEAISLAPEMTWLHTNRAHALMFLGRVEEARAIYLQHRGEKNVVGKKSWETAILEDFAELRKAGLKHPLMDNIEKQFSRPR